MLIAERLGITKCFGVLNISLNSTQGIHSNTEHASTEKEVLDAALICA